MATDWRLFVAVVASFLVAAGMTPLARRVAMKHGITDSPDQRKLHQTTTPYLGGVAIAVGVLAVSTFLPQWKTEAIVILVAALMVACVGLIDDLRTLGPLPRVGVEVVAATIVFVAGARVHLGNDVIDYLLTVGWLVVLTNAFNLLDNMDGCAGLVATVTAAGLAVAALLQGQVLVGGLAVVVAGTCVGFLIYNWHPATIFMGDAGSLFLGFLLSTIALKLRFPGSRASGVAAVILLAAPALFDTTLVVFSRVRTHRPVLIGGTDHTAHRLLHLGVRQRVVPFALAGVTTVCVTLGILVGRGRLPIEGVVVTVAAAYLGLLWAFLRVPIYDKLVHEVSPEPARMLAPTRAVAGEL